MVDLYPIVAGEMLETRTGQGTATSEWYGVGGLAALSPRRGRPGRPQGGVTPASANAMMPEGQIGPQKKQDKNDSIVACRGASPTTALSLSPPPWVFQIRLLGPCALHSPEFRDCLARRSVVPEKTGGTPPKGGFGLRGQRHWCCTSSLQSSPRQLTCKKAPGHRTRAMTRNKTRQQWEM